MNNYLKRDLFKLSCSPDYKARYVAEYIELHGRADRLRTMLEKYHNGTLEFKPTCPIDLLEEQLDKMNHYLEILEQRAAIEDVDLSNPTLYIKAPVSIRQLPQHECDTCRIWTLSQYKFFDFGWEYKLIDSDGREFTFSHADEGRKWVFDY